MTLHSFNNDLICSVLELYSEMDRETAQFQTATGLRCPPGCGQCCESVTPEVSVIELLPSAEELSSRREAQQWLERIAAAGEAKRCVFFQPDSLIRGNGHCLLYMFRPSVCRLFGFTSMKDKNGKPELVTCRHQKEQIPLLVKEAQHAILEGMAGPSFDYFFLKMVALDLSFGRRREPINRALHLALKRCGLTIQLMEGLPEMPSLDSKEPKVIKSDRVEEKEGRR